MPRPTHQAFKAALTPFLAVALLLAPESAHATSAVSVPQALEARAKLICTRVPNLLSRTDAQLQRLPAGPDTRGSIAWVKSRAEAASSRHRTQLADDLNNRANVLTQKLALLPNQKAALQKAQQTCQSMGYAA